MENNSSQQELISACRRGDKIAHGLMIEQYSMYIFAICYGILGSAPDAEDMTQEVFLKCYLSIGALRDDEQFRAWIGRIARNLCIDFLRRRKQNTCCLDDLPEQAHPDVFKPEYQDLHQALQRMPEAYRLPLVLYYLDGQDTHQIAQTLGLSVDGVHTRLSRARRELRKQLEEV